MLLSRQEVSHALRDQGNKDGASDGSETKVTNIDEQGRGDAKPLQSFVRDKKVKGIKRKIKETEKEFWEQLIKKYLYPINEDKAHQEKTQNDLIELRNKVCIFFILVNALFVTIVFSLQQVNLDSGGSISKQLPCANGNHGGSFEPISMAFTGVFGILLFIQFICMFVHRMSTFLHICSISELSDKHDDEEKKIQENMKTIMKFKSEKTEDSEEYETTDTDSDDEEQKAADNPRKRNGCRAQFDRSIRLLMKDFSSRTDQRAKSSIFDDAERQKTFIGVDMKTLHDMTNLATNTRFQKKIRRRQEELAKNRELKKALNKAKNKDKELLHGLPTGKSQIEVDFSDMPEEHRF